MKQRILLNKAVWIALGILTTFTICSILIPENRFKLYLDAARVGVWAVVWFITLKVALQTMFSANHRTGGDILGVAINMTAGIILLQALWIPFKRELAIPWGLPQNFRDVTDQLVVLGFLVAGVFYLMPIGNTIGVTPPRNYWFLLAAGVVGSLVAGVMIGLGLQISA